MPSKWSRTFALVICGTCTDLRRPARSSAAPFDLHNFEGCAILVAREGDDHANVVRKVSDLQTMHFETRCGAQPGEVEELVKVSKAERHLRQHAHARRCNTKRKS